ncbi:MAG: septal ring lytic transglycosylase RlpA family protein, partial [bacterium]
MRSKFAAVMIGILLLVSACAGPSVRMPVAADEYSVNGRKYKVLGTSTGFEQRGLASWYGGKFHGRLTASGEVYDMNKLTA